MPDRPKSLEERGLVPGAMVYLRCRVVLVADPAQDPGVDLCVETVRKDGSTDAATLVHWIRADHAVTLPEMAEAARLRVRGR